MWYKQQVQFAILPRIVKAIRICYKGQYSLQFELIHESEQGTITSAFPYIFKLPSSVNPRKNTSARLKTGTTKVENSRGTFQTSKFNVTYESHTEYLADICVFKLEYKMKKNGRGKTYLLVDLLSHRKIIEQEKPSSSKLQLKTITEKIFTRKININLTSPTQNEKTNNIINSFPIINNFIQVQLQDNDFFGYVHMYLGAVSLGWKIRDNKMSLCNFLCEEDEQKRKILEGQRKYINSIVEVGKCIKELTKQFIQTTYGFYEMTVKKSILATLGLYRKCQKIKQSVYQMQLGSDLIQQYDSLISEEDDGYLAALSELLLNVSNQKSMFEYYESKSIDHLYFDIHHIGQENILICDYVRALWQKMLGFLKDLTVDQFQSICKKETSETQKIWKMNCAKFINNGALDSKSSSSKNSIQVCYFQSKSVKNLKVESNLNFKVTTKLSSEFESCIYSSEVMKVRAVEVAKFKQWRNAHVGKQLVYYDEEYFHPLLLFENYQSIPKRQMKHGHIGLVVFVHGFKGSEYDLQRASQYLLRYNQNIEVLRIRTLDNDIDYTIEQMAVTVAEQIKRYILCSFLKIDSISIVGYSLGGIVSRAALSHLQQFREKMNVFVTFSSPHLGTYSTDNTLVKLGIWYMTKFNKCKVLQQLHTSRDLKTSAKSDMKILSEQEQISWFKKIVLVSCEEDQFVPHQSSRVEQNIQQKMVQNSGIFKRIGSPSSKMAVEGMRRIKSEMAEMADNIRKYAKRIQRVQVWFDNQNKKSTLDKLTGRQSHIEFLDNWRFLKWFFTIYGPQL